MVAKSIKDYFSEKHNQNLLKKFSKVGIKIIKETSSSNQKLQGLSFVITGALSTMTREEAKEKIHSLGGDVSESISKKTSYLLAGEEGGGKLDKAKKLGVKILSEKDFLDIILRGFVVK